LSTLFLSFSFSSAFSRRNGYGLLLLTLFLSIWANWYIISTYLVTSEEEIFIGNSLLSSMTIITLFYYLLLILTIVYISLLFPKYYSRILFTGLFLSSPIDLLWSLRMTIMTIVGFSLLAFLPPWLAVTLICLWATYDLIYRILDLDITFFAAYIPKLLILSYHLLIFISPNLRILFDYMIPITTYSAFLRYQHL